MIEIHAKTLGQILRVTGIILGKGILPKLDLSDPLKLGVTQYQWLHDCEEPVVWNMSGSIILGELGFWDTQAECYLDIAYEVPTKELTIEGCRKYYLATPDDLGVRVSEHISTYEPDSSRPLIMINI